MRLIALAVAVSCLLAAAATEAQQAGKIYRIGVLETRNATLNAANIEAFRRGLRELGYKDGLSFELVYRSSDGRNERFPALAGELVDLKVDLILTRGTPAALAAKNATRTSTIPVVMASSGDPVGAGLVGSLGRPGGNVTGLSNYNVEIYAKRVELLKELLPRLTRIAGLFNMASLSRQLAQWVAALRYENLPAEVVDRAKGVTLQGLASVLLGSLTPGGRQAVALMAVIDPFRKLVVYPSLLRSVRATWKQTFGTA